MKRYAVFLAGGNSTSIEAQRVQNAFDDDRGVVEFIDDNNMVVAQFQVGQIVGWSISK